MIKAEHKQLLQHMLGADERYKKKDWGFRNHFCSTLGNKDDANLVEMVKLGYVLLNYPSSNYRYFHATKAGAIAIGFKPYQLRNTNLATMTGQQ